MLPNYTTTLINDNGVHTGEYMSLSREGPTNAEVRPTISTTGASDDLPVTSATDAANTAFEHVMTKRSRERTAAINPQGPSTSHASHEGEGTDSYEDLDNSGLKKQRTFMATLACDICRSRKTRCDEDRPRCGYCKTMNLECTYQTPRATKKDQSMAVAINAIRRLESKIEDLTTAISGTKSGDFNASASQLPSAPLGPKSPHSATSHPSPSSRAHIIATLNSRQESSGNHDAAMSPPVVPTPGKSPFSATETTGTASTMSLSFSQHRVALWPAIQNILPFTFLEARSALSEDYIVEIEKLREPLPIRIDHPYGMYPETWLMSLPQSAMKGLADAYFAVFHRSSPILDRFFFHSSTLSTATESEFGCNVESCLVLLVLAMGCLAVKAHEEGDFPLPSRHVLYGTGFVRPDWYDLVTDDPPGLKFFNEARKRFGFLMCQTDIQAGQCYSLWTLYYAQILRPLDSWTTVNRAALCCTSILSRPESINFDEWEGDMFARLFWNTLMYETVITQELDLLPHSGLLEYEPDIPLPKFTSCPRPKTSISGLLSDEDDESFFNFHFLAQAAHRIILTRVKQNLYHFAERENYPTTTITAEMHHQLEQWRANLPPSLRFSDDENADDSESPAHVIAKAMLRSRYLVAKFHIGRPFLYKALHAATYTNEAEYTEVRDGLRGGMFWPTTMGSCTQMMSALPIKFGWCCQCFGQVLLFHAVARSHDQRLRDTLPAGWQEWVGIMTTLIEKCAQMSPGIAKDAELLRLLLPRDPAPDTTL